MESSTDAWRPMTGTSNGSFAFTTSSPFGNCNNRTTAEVWRMAGLDLEHPVTQREAQLATGE